ncbi:Methionine synthase [Dissostichus eleginoides]|uniref:Methionine synthase n=1 Tax=Dissostichus eleginoides TaxID=100907 RepID=A0AAD9F516_DISEL|nr:Methionine synthase [Dissostichus eleginoides]
MESTRTTLNLFIPISERSCMSLSLSHCRGPAAPFKAHLKHQGGLTLNCREEGPVDTAKQGQADKFSKALDDFPLCLECQTFMNMGNQHGTRLNFPGCSEDAFPKSPRLQIPRKRRRRVEGFGGFEHNLKITPGTPQAPPKARKLTKLQITSPPTFGEWDLEKTSRSCALLQPGETEKWERKELHHLRRGISVHRS